MANANGTEQFGHSSVDGYGFKLDEDADYHTYEEFMSGYIYVLARRASRWKNVIGSDQETLSKTTKVKRFCRKGIPTEHRPSVWMGLTNAELYLRDNPRMYDKLINEKADPKVEESIKLDIHRTFPDNIYFADITDPQAMRLPLKHVLSAVAIKNSRVGYCQGLNFVAGLLLLAVKNEEKAFWLLDTLINDILPDFYAPDMIALKTEQELLGEVVRWKLPAVHAHLEVLGVQWMLIGMKWFICLYADVMPVETVLRIWDCLFLEGPKILLRVALTLIKLNKDKILACKSFPDAVNLFRDLVKDPSTLQCHSFLESIFKETGSFPTARIKKMREDCHKRVLRNS
ncbi:hypothetical protein LOTGIDRAFT_187086 [Lottia gigantea]|uniref:Growth hormone-regulated TBC protein 1 n=1 Tax=Lottia gigantea TaxID=225164 RepID=V4AYT8_LOTGI|nr:hypothetical protein LOTGIDRAFT_187086 [Lottia gigantea]ESO98866.1 hypothetical protein LOTGIDRAFT_187086 [Lottia gigantea]